MPALPIIADTYRCALNWKDATGQTATNVIHIRTATSGHTASQVMAGLDSSVIANMWLPVVNTAVVDNVAITPLDGVSATQVFHPATPAHWTGGNPPDFSPASSAIITLRTIHRGRSKRGRVFLPFASENIISAGNLNSTTAGNVTTAWNTFETNLAAAAVPEGLVVASYKLASAEDIFTLACETVLATQRRRQGRLRSA